RRAAALLRWRPRAAARRRETGRAQRARLLHDPRTQRGRASRLAGGGRGRLRGSSNTWWEPVAPTRYIGFRLEFGRLTEQSAPAPGGVAGLSGAEARALIRAGRWRQTTAGMAVGWEQANLVIL